MFRWWVDRRTRNIFCNLFDITDHLLQWLAMDGYRGASADGSIGGSHEQPRISAHTDCNNMLQIQAWSWMATGGLSF